MPHRLARAALAIALALLVGSSAACGVRLEEAPPPVPTPDAVEVARAEAVDAAESIALAAEAVTGADPAVQESLAQIAAGSRRQAQLLGGTWTPPPRPTATDDPSAPTGSASPVVASVADVVGILLDGATSARAGSAVADPAVGRLLVSIAVWRDLAALSLVDTAAASGVEIEPVVLAVGGVDDVALQISTIGANPELVRTLDGTAFAYEALAARVEDAARREAWVERSSVLRRTAETVARASGVAETSADPREGVYDVSEVLRLDPDAAVASLETSLAVLWANADLPAGLRPVAADAALECYRLALATGARLGALDSSAVVLPGLVTP